MYAWQRAVLLLPWHGGTAVECLTLHMQGAGSASNVDVTCCRLLVLLPSRACRRPDQRASLGSAKPHNTKNPSCWGFDSKRTTSEIALAGIPLYLGHWMATLSCSRVSYGACWRRGPYPARCWQFQHPARAGSMTVVVPGVAGPGQRVPPCKGCNAWC